jgi:16S rRNA (cytidine1402-2'-O)-methyltransferase
VPGPCAAITALVVSGLPTNSFVFAGFLPRRPSERRRALEELRTERRTWVVYEAPHRLPACLADLEAALGDRTIAIARELTKLHEEIFRGSISQAREHFADNARGEITLVISGAPEDNLWDEARVRARLAGLLAQGCSRTEAAQQVAAESGWARRAVYQLSLQHPLGENE